MYGEVGGGGGRGVTERSCGRLPGPMKMVVQKWRGQSPLALAGQCANGHGKGFIIHYLLLIRQSDYYLLLYSIARVITCDW